jgi:flagellar basal-body rod protein FlgC
MDYQNAFAISGAGMAVERTRVEVAAVNLANAQTVASSNETVFQPLQVVARSAPAALRVEGGSAFAALVEGGLAAPVATIEPQARPGRRAHEPGHPLADDKGFVFHPGVDPAREMTTLVGAVRSYEANVAAMNAARTIALKALDIGGGT